jgi:hypothetical protein
MLLLEASMFAATTLKKLVEPGAPGNTLVPSIVMPDLHMTERVEIASLLPALQSLTQDFAARFKVFPHLCCELAATRVEQLGLGLTYVNGIFLRGNEGHAHAWNMSSKLGIYVDVTARQFSEALPSILIVPINSEFAQKHYLHDWHITW